MARTFDGSTQFGDSATLVNVATGSIALFFKPASLPSASTERDYILNFQTSGLGDGSSVKDKVLLLTNTGAVKAIVFDGASKVASSGSTVVSVGTWSLIGMTFDGTNLKVHVDSTYGAGSVAAGNSYTGYANPTLVLCRKPTAADGETTVSRANGDVFQICIWHGYTLTSTDWGNLRTGTDPTTIGTGATTRYIWPFAGTTSPEPESVNSKDMTLGGSPPQADDPTFGGGGDTISVTDLTSSRVYQRAAGTTAKTITFSGTYTGTDPTTVEVQIQKHSDGTEVQAFTALSSATISAGAWSGTLSVPQGGWYKFVARGVDGSSNVLATSSASTNKWGVGVNILTAGQSNMSNMFDRASGATTTNDLTRRYDAGTWGAVTGTGAIRLANQIQAGLAGTGEAGTDIPIGLLDFAVSGSGMHATNGSGYWMDTAAGSPYKLAQAAVQAVDCELVLWHQGETDSILGTTKAQYKTDLDTLYSNFRTDSSRSTSELKFGVGILGNISNATATDASTDAIRQAQLEWVRDTTGAFFAGSSVDMVRAAGDDFHWSATNEPYYDRMGRRYAQAVLKQLGIEANGAEGPKIASATRDSSATDIVLALTQNGGTALEEADGTTDGGSLTGFEVSDDDFATTLTISSTAFDSGNIVLTLSAAPADSDTIKVRYQYGENPSITKVVYDDQTPQSDTLGFPLQPTIGSFTATLIGARVPITGVSTTGAVGSLTVDTQTGSVSASVELPGLIATGGVGRVAILGATSQIWTPIAPAAGAWTPA